MKLSTRVRYGLRAALALAGCYDQGPIQLKAIAAREDLSVKYLEQLMAMLKSARIVRSVRGSKGGYSLTRPPSQIRLLDVFTALEGPVITVECLLGEGRCERISGCFARNLWVRVQEAITDVLESMTLQELIDLGRSDGALHYDI